MRMRSFTTPFFWVALAVAAGMGAGCRKAEPPPRVPSPPSVRLYFMSTVAGALEPCGCVKDMLGGIDHAAAIITPDGPSAPPQLVLGVGPLLFQDPKLASERREQDLWKAETLAAAMGELGLRGWAPGANDFAAGAPELARLAQQSGAALLAANLSAEQVPVQGARVFDAGGYKVGVVGIAALPEGAPPPARDPAEALEAAARELDAAGAQIRVALIAGARGDGLRLAERVTGFDVIALGKGVEQGEANDAPFPPVLMGETLVVQAPNHLQALAIVDLFVRGDDFGFEDGMGLEREERRQSLDRRKAELERRLVRAGEMATSDAAQAAALRAEIDKVTAQRAALDAQPAPAPEGRGSYFTYALTEVRESSGSEPKVVGRMRDYYRRVNDHNRVAFKDRRPPPAPPGTSHYVGGAACTSCHAAADTFWRTTKHSGAYATLTDQFKEYNLDCVSCHVTGYERPGGSTVTHVEALRDVQCEACHGPGSRHVDSSGDTALITLTPDPSVCKGCHHAPHVPADWDAARAWPNILGPGHGQPAR